MVHYSPLGEHWEESTKTPLGPTSAKSRQYICGAKGVEWWKFDREGTPMTTTQNEKAARFRALHDGPGAFVIPNPWDVGSARLLAGLGFQALATSSAASAT